uniref:Uncharacterized protein n=1 Tax=Rhizophora mucronata TaxID=61149 RepID=A0A2P2N2L5_RHIMU
MSFVNLGLVVFLVNYGNAILDRGFSVFLLSL